MKNYKIFNNKIINNIYKNIGSILSMHHEKIIINTNILWKLFNFFDFYIFISSGLLSIKNLLNRKVLYN